MAEVTVISTDKSILSSIKKLLGMTDEYTAFDVDIIIHINTVLSILGDLGFGPTSGFQISDNTQLWTDYIPENPTTNKAKTYVYLKVRMMFDPPTNSSVVDSINRAITELEWRLANPTDPISLTTEVPIV
jgi:hypothetical protein